MHITEEQRVKTHIERAVVVGTSATLTLAEWQRTITDFGGMCAYCLTKPFAVMEHFVPVEIAGTHVKNCVPACTGCNGKKGLSTGDGLVNLFGKETIERIASYLHSRKEGDGGDNPLVNRTEDCNSNPRSLAPIIEGDTVYSPRQFARFIGRSTLTLQRWDRQGILCAYRTLTNRRFYTHQQLTAYFEEGKTE
jgi:hypothetical protein